MQVTKYVHVRNHIRGIRQSKGGATFKITGDTSNINAGVQVQVALCSLEDNYCRKTGRESAEKKAINVVQLGNLAEFLAKKTKTKKHMRVARTKYDFHFLSDYFLPR